MTDPSPIIGIDLGTTNSVVAAFTETGPQVLGPAAGEVGGEATLPSAVGLDAGGTLLVGAAARNQAIVAPERTLLSVKRHMGEETLLPLGEQRLKPEAVSSLVLEALKRRAEAASGQEVARAVITVPAYFTDAQRQATREAGALAGLEVVRILNEPTAAALAFGGRAQKHQRLLVYDLGGGTFDVSVVRAESGVVEVETSLGDNHLGGDDIDQAMAAHLADHARREMGIEALDLVAKARILRAAEEAKIALSTSPFAATRLDHIGEVGGRPVHLAYEWSRQAFETLVAPFIDRTMTLVDRALADAGLQPGAIDRVLLVGGSTRIPQVRERIVRRLGREPEAGVDPDLCVALGAALQAGIEMGHSSRGVLVDVTPYTFGTSVLGIVDGMPHASQFVPLIRRNTRLPARYSEVFWKTTPEQRQVDIKVYQGDALVADDNTLVGIFTFSNLETGERALEEGLVLTYALDHNGVLDVEAHERSTGRRLACRIDNVLGRKDAAAMARARAELDVALGREPRALASPADGVEPDATCRSPAIAEIIRRAEAALPRAAPEDADQMRELVASIRGVGDQEAEKLAADLDDILFYVEA